jgi:NADH-quinone oxidoreductase subunit N
MDLSGLNLIGLLPEMIVAGGGLLVLLVHALWRGRLDGALRGLSLAAVLAAGAAALLTPDAGPAAFGAAVSDPLALAGRVVTLVVLALLLLGAEDYARSRRAPLAEYHALLLFAAVGMLALASAGDLVTVFLGIEILSLSLYALAGLLGQREGSREAALKYFLTGSYASGFLLFGMALIYGASGTTQLAGIARGLLDHPAGEWVALGGATLMLAGFLFKVAAVPFHAWAPDVYTGSPTPVTAFMSSAAKAAAFAGFGRVFLPLSGLAEGWGPLLAASAALTMVLGNFSALMQDQVKRMLAFSSIAHAGYLLLGVLAAGRAGESLEAVLFYLLPYSLITVGFFLVAAEVSRQGGGEYAMDDFKGLARRNPLLAVLVAIFAFGLAGIPPTAGFMGKLYIFSAAVRTGHTALAVLGVLTSVVSVYYYLRPVVYSWFHEPEAGRSAVLHLPAGLLTAALIAAFGVLLLGLWPELWLRLTLGIGG